MQYHETVFKKEAVEHLKVKKGGKYIDATLGDAGHTLEILKLGGSVLGIDQDPGAHTRSLERIPEDLRSNFKGVCANFKDIDKVAAENGFGAVDGILYDLGTSFYQLEEAERGFSFNSDASLDMRMNPALQVSAKDLVNALSEKELTRMLSEYGEEHKARTISKAIVKARKDRPLELCSELAKVIESVSPRRPGDRLHPATKTFQALRIAVNDEIESLETSLSRAASLLIPGGRLIIISFHSLEDRKAKDGRPGLKKVFEKPLIPSEEEIKVNPRARSAKLRVWEKE